MIGKVPPTTLAAILDRTGVDDPAVQLGPGFGEDAAVIDLGTTWLVISTDPLSLAAEELGHLAIHVACNDVAVGGARPRWVTTALFVPDEDPETIDLLTGQLDETARCLDVAIVGGHTEYAPSLDRPLAVLTAFGVTDHPVSTGGANPDDVVILTGGPAIEGTAILATDFRDDLRKRGVAPAVIDRGADRIAAISVVDEAMAVRTFASGMHDPTEGGVLAGLVEIAHAAGCRLDIDPTHIPVPSDTAVICDAMDVDPLCIFGSGALLVTVPAADTAAALEALAALDGEATVIGTVVDGSPAVHLGETLVTEVPRDHLYPLWE